MRRALLFFAVCLALAPALSAHDPEGALQVQGLQGTMRLYRFETEPWPLEPGRPLPDNSRVELDEGALLRLRFSHYLDLCLIGPARLTVYVVPAPAAGELADDRVVLKLDDGALLSDGRFQFGRPADIVLSLPDRSLPLPKDKVLLVQARSGRSQFFGLEAMPQRKAVRLEPGVEAQAGSLQPGAEVPLKKAPFPLLAFDELERPVPIFVIARDFNKDLGLWPRPAVLGPLLSERLQRVPGLRVVEGSGDTYFAYRANGALKSGQDFFLKELGRARGARWVLVGNCVVESLRQDRERRVRGLAEVRVLESEGDSEGLELVSEVGDTRVARAGRALELVARQAFEAASSEVAGHIEWQLKNLLQGKAHGDSLLKLVLENADEDALTDLRARLAGMDSVQRVFRRSYAGGVAKFDLMLRKTEADFDAQWKAWPAQDRAFEALNAPPQERRYRAAKKP